MKIKNTFLLAVGLGAGYVLGTKAGRKRFEELKGRAGEFLHDPRVQSGVANLADQVSKNADKIPSPVSDVIKSAAESVHNSLHTEPNGQPPA